MIVLRTSIGPQRDAASQNTSNTKISLHVWHDTQKEGVRGGVRVTIHRGLHREGTP